MCISCFFSWVFPGSIATRWRVSPLCGIAHAKLTPNQMKISFWFKTSNNPWKSKLLNHTNVRIGSHVDLAKHHTFDQVSFRFFVTVTENGTFSTINISETIAGATGGDRFYYKSNKQATRKCKNWTLKSKRKKRKHLFENVTPNTRESSAVQWSIKTQKNINT